MDIPGTGTNQMIFLTDLAENRSDNVTIVDLRLDKAFDVGNSGRVSLSWTSTTSSTPMP